MRVCGSHFTFDSSSFEFGFIDFYFLVTRCSAMLETSFRLIDDFGYCIVRSTDA